jgi:hypothetical protein
VVVAPAMRDHLGFRTENQRVVVVEPGGRHGGSIGPGW